MISVVMVDLALGTILGGCSHDRSAALSTILYVVSLVVSGMYINSRPVCRASHYPLALAIGRILRTLSPA